MVICLLYWISLLRQKREEASIQFGFGVGMEYGLQALQFFDYNQVNLSNLMEFGHKLI